MVFNSLWFISVGNVNLDVSFTLDSYPGVGVNVVARGLWLGVGGAAVNYSACVAKLGHRVSVVSLVNPLMVKLGLLEELSRLGVDTSYVRVVDGDPNIAVIIMVPGESQRTIVSYRGVSRLLDASMIPNVGDHVHLASVPARILLDTRARIGSKPLSYDPGGEASRDPASVRSAVRVADWVFVNEKELELLTGFRGFEGASRLLESGVGMVIVKRGSEGALVVTRSLRLSMRAPRIEKPVDVVGTGDAFDAAFNVYYLETNDPQIALRHAIAAGALKTMLRGSSNMPSRADVESLARRIH